MVAEAKPVSPLSAGTSWGVASRAMYEAWAAAAEAEALAAEAVDAAAAVLEAEE